MTRAFSRSLTSVTLITSLLAAVGIASAQQTTTTSGITTPGLQERGPGVEKFFRIRTPGAATIAPDGSLYVRDWPDGVFQLFRIPPSDKPDKPATAAHIKTWSPAMMPKAAIKPPRKPAWAVLVSKARLPGPGIAAH